MIVQTKINDLKVKTKNLHKLVIILIINTIVRSLSGYDYCYDKDYCYLSNPVERVEKILIVSCYKNYSLTVNLKIVEDSVSKVLQKLHNMMMHMRNGNRKEKKIKTHFKIYQVNKGNSDFGSFCINLHEEVSKSNADLAIISEANFSKDDDSTYRELFKKYKFEEFYVENC